MLQHPENKSRLKNLSFLILFLPVLLLSDGCAVSSQVCEKDGIPFCKSAGNFTGQWYDYYERALSCMEGECYQAALSDLNEAIKRRSDDRMRARTYGRHLTDYFPHREKGMIHYLSGDYEAAKGELNLSLEQYPSAKAFFYLNEVRRRILEQEKQAPSEPGLTIVSPKLPSNQDEIWTRDYPLVISGIAEDEKQYVSEILLGNRTVFMEGSNRTVKFAEALKLDQGRHEIPVVVRNLLSGETEHRLIVYVDRSGPVITVEEFVPGVRITGYLYDESGEISLFMNMNKKKLDIPKGKDVRFEILLDQGTESLTLLVRDRLGNETETRIDADMSACVTHPLRLAQNTSEALTDDSGSFSALLKARGSRYPEIILQEWSDNETVFKEAIYIKGKVSGQKNIEEVSINNTRISHRPGRVISFSHFLRLNHGKNIVRIKAVDISGNTSVREVCFTRQIPQAFQLKHRYGLAIHPFEATDRGDIEQILFQHHFLKDMTARRRFRITIRDKLEELFQGHGLSLSNKADPGSIHSVLQGIVHETANGIEIGVSLENIDASEILVTADVYDESKDRLTLELMADRLAEKLHRKVPLVGYSIAQITENRIVLTPEKQIPAQRRLRGSWPLIVYREKNPEDGFHGSDTEIVAEAAIDALAGNGKIISVIENGRHGSIRLKDKAVSR